MRTSDVATFNTQRFEEDVAAMRARREAVHARGEDVYRRTGKLDPNVDIYGKIRLSRNAMTSEDGFAVLKNGIALPFLFKRDGTGSMAENVDKAFFASGEVDKMLGGIRSRYNTQIANAVIQDVVDIHPVFQMTQFESDERVAEQQRLLIPDRNGGDSTEDYDIGLVYAMFGIDADIWRYGLKGHMQVVGDQIGRGSVYPESIKNRLGFTLQSEMSTSDVCRKLLTNWHVYYVQVGSGGGASRNSTTTWWEKRLGKNRVVLVPDPDRLAYAQAGLVYVTETDQPTEDGFVRFTTADGANKVLSFGEAREVWGWLQVAKPNFGAQAKLPGYNRIPMPGSKFAHYRHVWPVDDPRAYENVTPAEGEDAGEVYGSGSKSSKPVDWSKF